MFKKWRKAAVLVLIFLLAVSKPAQAALYEGNFVPYDLGSLSIAAAPYSVYYLQKDDTLMSVSKKMKVDVNILYGINNLNAASQLAAGDKIFIPASAASRVHIVQKGETLWEISRGYQLSLKDVLQANPTVNVRTVQIGTKINIPVTGKVISPAGTMEPSRGYISGAYYVWPLMGTITSAFGTRSSGYHHGIDISGNTGDPVKAAADGKVSFAGVKEVYGNTIMISHADGRVTLYAHLSAIYVKAGQAVAKGEKIGAVGTTGLTTGPHLHFEVRQGSEFVNPLDTFR